MLAGAAVASSVVATTWSEQTPEAAEEDDPSRRKVMVIDLNRCTGCQACVVACKAQHGVRLGGFRSWVSEREDGAYPDATRHFLPRLCNHCAEGPCRKVCPTGATGIRADGIVTIDHERCIGCRHCMVACPYSARYFNPQDDPPSLQDRFVARTRGTVDKCDFCAGRLDKGESPACVGTCPNSARIFGTVADVAIDDARPLLLELGTKPSVHYRGGRPEIFEPNVGGTGS